MAIIEDIKCARCDRKYSGVRSRCPYCGARRINFGKYSKDSDNAKGKMLIGILILSIFTVAAGILLFTTPGTESDTPEEDPSLSSIEDSTLSLPAIETPTPTPVVMETPKPLELETVQIWIGLERRAPNEFTLSPRWGLAIQLRASLDPPGIDVPVTWQHDSDPDNPVISIEDVVGGIEVRGLRNGSATLTVRAGDLEDRVIVRVTGIS